GDEVSSHVDKRQSDTVQGGGERTHAQLLLDSTGDAGCGSRRDPYAPTHDAHRSVQAMQSPQGLQPSKTEDVCLIGSSPCSRGMTVAPRAPAGAAQATRSPAAGFPGSGTATPDASLPRCFGLNSRLPSIAQLCVQWHSPRSIEATW